ncbi:MAG: DUF1045 domain-containing protein [Pikeienuella sp.]
MSGFGRYAVFYAPPKGSALARFGAAWLGRDAETGAGAAQPEIEGLDLEAASATPRRYGFLCTLKAPFRLAEGTDAAGLEAALAVLAAGIAPFACAPLAVEPLGGFVAFRPGASCAALAALAAACVTGLDRFRAPAPESEIARRRAAGLTPAQEAHLARWGYPYVLDEFRFHLTLTGALSDAARGRAVEVAARLAGPAIEGAFAVGEICLFGEDETRHFHILNRFPLTGPAGR